jgi:hypothetical protein
MEVLGRLWARVSATVPHAGGTTLLAAAGLAAVLVLFPALWRTTRHVVTIAHEGAHGVVALVTGRRLAGIRLHSDTSGLTVSAGRPRGPGMVLTCAAGYTGPALFGLGAAALLASGHAIGLLWALLVLLALLLVQIRNWYGLWSVLVTGAVVAVGTWFLLLAAPKAVVELQRARRRRAVADSDADQLARLTRVPAVVWVGLFLLVDLGALVLGGWWLLDR